MNQVNNSLESTIKRFLEMDKNHDFQLSGIENPQAAAKPGACSEAAPSESFGAHLAKAGFAPSAERATRYFADHKDFMKAWGQRIDPNGGPGKINHAQATAFLLNKIGDPKSVAEAHLSARYPEMDAEHLSDNAEYLAKSGLNATQIRDAIQVFARYFPTAEAREYAEHSIGLNNIGRFILYAARQKHELSSGLDARLHRGEEMESALASIRTDLFTNLDYNNW